MSDEPTSENSGLVIDDATPDTSIGGGEIIPVSDAGAAKSVTTGQVKDYTIAQIAAAAAASGISLDNDKVYLLQGGAIKPLTAADLAAAIMNAAFGRTAVVEINGNEVIAVKDASDRKTITVDALKAWLEDNLEIEADIDISSMPGASEPLSDTDLLVVARGSSNGKLAIATFKDYVLGKLAAYVGALTAAQSVGTSDVLYIVQGGTAKKCTVAQLLASISPGDVNGPQATTENKVPQWDSANKTLKDGLVVVTEIASAPTGTKVASESAVRNAISASAESVLAAAGDVKAPSTTTALNIPQWSSTSKKLDDGLAVQTSVRPAASATNAAVPTEAAVRTAITNALDSSGFMKTTDIHYESIFVPATQMFSGGEDDTGYEGGGVVPFDYQADASTNFAITFPSDWDGGNVKAKLFWMSPEGTAGQTVVFTLGGRSLGDGDTKAPPSTNVTIADAFIGSGKMHITTSEAYTIDGTRAGSQPVTFVLSRDVSEGTLDKTVAVLGVEIQFGRTTNAAQW